MKSLLETITRVRIADLVQYPGNAKRGDVPAIRASLEENDQFAPVVVQKSTMYVLAGNHTVQAAGQAGWEEIDAVVVDVDDRRALKINLAANRTADRGGYDTDARAALLTLLEGDYEGTGYGPEDIEKFTKIMEEMPEPGDAPSEDFDHVWGVIITCDTEEKQAELLARFHGEGLAVRSLMT